MAQLRNPRIEHSKRKYITLVLIPMSDRVAPLDFDFSWAKSAMVIGTTFCDVRWGPIYSMDSEPVYRALSSVWLLFFFAMWELVHALHGSFGGHMTGFMKVIRLSVWGYYLLKEALVYSG